jgi:hypothetical protein
MGTGVLVPVIPAATPAAAAGSISMDTFMLLLARLLSIVASDENVLLCF